MRHRIQRPTMAERLSNAADRKRPWWQKSEVRELANDFNRMSRRASQQDEEARPYRGSRTERTHRRGFFG
jgi:hypothetical protein